MEIDRPDFGRMEGRYANFFRVGYNAFEFVVDFGQSYAEPRRESFHTRIVTSPHHAKALLEMLKECISKHEKDFGPAKEPEE